MEKTIERKKQDNQKPPTSGGNDLGKQEKAEEIRDSVKTQRSSTSDPEGGWFRKGEHKHVFEYTVETTYDQCGWILEYTVHPGNEYGNRTFKALYIDILFHRILVKNMLNISKLTQCKSSNTFISPKFKSYAK